MPNFNSLLLIILDGFGVSTDKHGNPVAEAKTPNLNEIEKKYPFTTIQASGIAVGLPWGEAGNSEVGHLTMGSGKIIYHHLPRIIYSIYDGTFFENEALQKAVQHVKKNNSSLHIAGLMSSGSVHSYIDHLYALLDLAKKNHITKVFLHIFTDGKDAPPKEGAKFIQMLEERMEKEWPFAKIASVIGRVYAMDRDEEWKRIHMAYKLMTEGEGEKIKSASEYAAKSYENNITDEFINPGIITDEKNGVLGLIQEKDALIFLNFREDSMREITNAFISDAFDYFPRTKIANLLVVTMTEYSEDFKNAYAAFPPIEVDWPLARVLSDAGLRQLRVAETQKYAHITYFFNGGQEKPYPGEDRILIHSDTSAHFDDKPQMKAEEITSQIVDKINSYDVIIANFANADMVGHTGNFEAAVKAVEILDESIGQIKNSALNNNSIILITGDHGNIELKRNISTGEKLTEHSLNPVPLYLVGNQFRRRESLKEEEIRNKKEEVGGILTDIAPTIIELLELKKPPEMTGKNLLEILLK